MKKILPFLLILGVAISGCSKKVERISPEEEVAVKNILASWETWVPARKSDGTAPMITFEELYKNLKPEETAFLDKIRHLKPGGKFPGNEVMFFAQISGQKFERGGKEHTIGTQYLPRWTYEAYRIMMAAMQKELGKQLLIESGFRSPAYQLYTFVYYMPEHGFSIQETNRWVALPGHSEHGDPERQAIDFINMQGINGDDEGQTAETFEKLPEFEWLQKRAKDFGFELSYPRGHKDTVYEPWHWRLVMPKKTTTVKPLEK